MERVLILQTDHALEPRDRARGSGWRWFGWINAGLAIALVAAGLTLAGLSWGGNLASQVIRFRLVFNDGASGAAALGAAAESETYVAPDRARALNAAVPFSSAPLIPARPFQFVSSNESFARARDCLASAAWYEAGDDTTGQKSVVQVILNRVMNPAFPKTVCGVVFQGSERVTGCQFTYSCDGSMRSRIPSPAAWSRARTNAENALSGFVDPTVGLATHYHTDWVFPRWSNSLTKIARVGTHLFFRFPGQLGQPGAFQSPSIGMEPQIAELAMLSPAHGLANELPIDGALAAAGVQQLAFSMSPQAIHRELMGNRISASDGAGAQFALQLNMQAAWGSYARVARTLCGNMNRCTVMGWAPDQAPTGMDGFRARRGSALFVYRKSGDGAEQALWDCRQFLRPDAQCLPGTAAPSIDQRTRGIAADDVALPPHAALATN